jgi:hypothetical protein
LSNRRSRNEERCSGQRGENQNFHAHLHPLI